MKELLTILENMNSYDLDILLKAADMKYAGLRKNEKVAALMNFYKQEDCILNIWKSLDKVESAILTLIVQCNYRPYSSDFKKLEEKFGEGSIKFFTDDYGHYSKKKTKLNLIRINKRYPDFIKKEIKRLNIIPPLPIEFNPVKDVGSIDEYHGKIIDRASRISDFVKC